MLSEYKNIMNPNDLPRRRKDLHWFMAGFADAEGCFSVSVKKQETTRFGWVLDPVFHVTQHKNHRNILEIFKRELQCGRIIQKPGQPETLQYIVENRRQLAEKILPFFRKYKLIAKKRDYELFSEIVQGMENKKHWTKEGFKELLEKAFMMNQHGKQRKYSLEHVLSNLQDPQRPYVGHPKKT